MVLIPLARVSSVEFYSCTHSPRREKVQASCKESSGRTAAWVAHSGVCRMRCCAFQDLGATAYGASDYVLSRGRSTTTIKKTCGRHLSGTTIKTARPPAVSTPGVIVHDIVDGDRFDSQYWQHSKSARSSHRQCDVLFASSIADLNSGFVVVHAAGTVHDQLEKGSPAHLTVRAPGVSDLHWSGLTVRESELHIKAHVVCTTGGRMRGFWVVDDTPPVDELVVGGSHESTSTSPAAESED